MEPFPKSSITAIVLAGGQSSRMGQDKALINLGGVPLLKQICLIATECAMGVYVITPAIELYHSILPNGCQLIREVCLPGETLPHGPLVGFAQALTQVNTDWVLLLACDLPYLSASQLQQWSQSLYTVTEDMMAVLPRRNNRWEPLCGFYRCSCLALLNEFIRQGGRSFQDWLGRQSVQELLVSDPNVLFNCNTPEDLAKITAKYNFLA
ncbi:molybdenum cofactor guanylyltransferase [Gloeothece verrucosa]|uniref:Probable molybdenum cofactor guanylyltransferase n=1 Tax=Gloeothece verrucosa (strain PCC 7822) TaxID=497965 RepID=E0UBX7_GLOV7|nr:molybdenum cofactor guanylyltransferase [Gloeothece verrucosa]ADN15192.1 molybdopterin-guanine dinucleotide biosynthesis protein A [Gloeothece verrucosa PCC 7822]